MSRGERSQTARRRTRAGGIPALAATALILALAGCQTLPAAPWPAWRPNILLPGRGARRQAWDAWGRIHLRDGDLVFVKGESRILLGLLNFSEFSAQIAHSEFSHVGVVAVEDGEPVVYDIITDGAFRRPFGQYAADRRTWALAVKRLHPAFQDCIPPALEFCRQVYRRQVRFDDDFRLDNDRYYCAELVEVAFRHGGRPLSAPVRIDALPGFAKLSPVTVGLIEAATPISREQEVFLPGNDDYGLWSCPCLVTVLEKTDARAPPHARVGRSLGE